MKPKMHGLKGLNNFRFPSPAYFGLGLAAVFVLVLTFLVRGMIMPAKSSGTFDPFLKTQAVADKKSEYVYKIRATQTVNSTLLQEAHSISDIAPQLWKNIVMPHNDRVELNHKAGKYREQGNSYDYFKDSDYMMVLNYASVEISVISNGSILSSESKSDLLTEEQRYYMTLADPGTNINIRIRFSYKNTSGENPTNNTIGGTVAVTVVPNKEAQYPGGLVKLNQYFYEQTTSPVPEISAYFKKQQAILQFTVDKEGKAGSAIILKTSGDPKTDQLLLKAVDTMPLWTPAENAKGEKTEQPFFIPFFGEGC